MTDSCFGTGDYFGVVTLPCQELPNSMCNKTRSERHNKSKRFPTSTKPYHTNQQFRSSLRTPFLTHICDIIVHVSARWNSWYGCSTYSLILFSKILHSGVFILFDYMLKWVYSLLVNLMVPPKRRLCHSHLLVFATEELQSFWLCLKV